MLQARRRAAEGRALVRAATASSEAAGKPGVSSIQPAQRPDSEDRDCATSVPLATSRSSQQIHFRYTPCESKQRALPQCAMPLSWAARYNCRVATTETRPDP